MSVSGLLQASVAAGPLVKGASEAHKTHADVCGSQSCWSAALLKRSSLRRQKSSTLWGSWQRKANQASSAFGGFPKLQAQCSSEGWTRRVGLGLLGSGAGLVSAETVHAEVLTTANQVYGQLAAEGLELSVQLIYLIILLALLGSGSYLVVRQVLIRRALENAAKDLQDRVRTGQASPAEYFELGAVMLRKKLYMQANKYLEQAAQKWDGEQQELAQVYNALGFSYFREGRTKEAIKQYEKALDLAPAYVVAWNNLGDAREAQKDLEKAFEAYKKASAFDPNNKVAKDKVEEIRNRLTRRGITVT